MCLCFFVKLYLLLWKSGVHSIRHNLPKTIFDILVPVAFFLLMTVSRADYEQSTKRPLPVSCFFEESFFTPPYGPRLSPAVAYSPNNSVFDEIINKIARRYDNDTKLTYIGVDTAENLENLLMQNSTIIAGIQFNHPENITAIPDNFNFSLRFPAMMRWYNKPWPTDVLYREQVIRRYPQETLDWDFYRKEGFLVLQCRIMNSLHSFNYSGNIIPNARTLTRKFPDYPENLNFEKIQFLFPSLILMSFYYPYINAICRIVAEKKQTMELMKLMGISSAFYWLCVYLKEILLRIVTVTIVVGLMKTPIGYSKAVLEHSDFFLLWQFFVVYCVCSTSLGFLLSIFFNNIKPAICVSTIIWFASFMPFSFTHVDIETVPQVALHFIPNTAMGFGVKLIFQLELMMDNGLDESTLWTGDLFPYKSLSVGTIMSIMLYASVVFLAIFIYAVPISPGTYGIAAPVHYLFTKGFWSKRRVDNRLRDGETQQEDDDEDSPNFQNKPENRTPGICIRKLTKKFAKGKPAIVRNLSLNVYKNEITVLCGPNACGKTTLLLILTGMLRATSGMALIDGYDVTQQTNLARKSMGFCPQESIWLEGLTVREHLLFYGLIKGSKIKSAFEDMRRYSKLLEFRNELNVVTSKLSLGTQRKLSIALAFCGRSQFVFLDYPSHGLDPVARQLFWNFLANEKNDRHILMTTNLPDEVDATADRVAFMTNGELKFCGSTTFVRERFGAYRLVCIKDDDCKAIATTRLLDQYFPDTTLETETKHHMSYLLSYQKVHKFGRFFEKLETFYRAQLKLKSFRISIATTEFLFNEFAEEAVSDETFEIEDDFSDGCMCRMASIPYQLAAMFMKRFLCGIRDWRSFALYHLFVVIMMIPIVYDLYPRTPYEPNPPPLTISLDSYNNSNYCFLESDPVFDDSDPGRIRQNITDGYRRMFSSEGSLITLNASELGTYAPQLGVQKYRHNFLVGVLVRKDRYIYTNTLSALHALPISAKLYMSSRLFPARNFTVINEPLRGNATVTDQATTEYLNMEALGMSFPIFIGILLAVMLSERVIFHIKEKRHGTKMKQYVNGVNHFIFWLTSIIWDAVIGIVVILAIVIALYISGRTFWSETETLYIVASILFIFNLTMAPIIYLLSLMFSEPATGVNALCAINMLLCMLISVNHYGVQFIPGPMLKQSLSLIPICALIECFIKLSTIQKRCPSQCGEPCDHEKLCEDHPVCCPQLPFLWTDEHIRRELLFMAVAGFAAFLILLAVEHEISKQLLSYAWNFILRPTSFRKNSEEKRDNISKHSINESVSEDSVGDGQQNLCCGPRKSERMEERMNMLKVSTYYGIRLAVDEISLNLRLGECVGLIGKNGKGKTTIFKMLTGEHRICYGRAFMFGSNLKWNTRKTNDFVGYCPQSDHLWDELTVCETLRFFCLLRGTNYDRTSRLANKLNLSQHFTQKVSRLSGGSKQVLSIVIALIGYPTVILIDEATTCIDVSTRRKLWTILSKLCDAGKSILLSSDGIQEYQTVCTRFKIAENDDVSVVENEPISIEIFIESNMAEYETNNSGIVDFMKSSFKEATLRSTLDNFLTFDMPYAPNVLSKVFVAFERRKRQLCIENYFVSLK